MPTFDSQRQHRRSIRLKGYDYSQSGAYYVTLCTRERACLLGDVIAGQVRLTRLGEIAAEAWRWLADHYPYVTLGAWVVMPNHLHAILAIGGDERRGGSAWVHASRAAPTALGPSQHKPLGSLIGAFKTVSTKRMNAYLDVAGNVIWQRAFYEHIIRNTGERGAIEAYIRGNPAHWPADLDNPSNWR